MNVDGSRGGQGDRAWVVGFWVLSFLWVGGLESAGLAGECPPGAGPGPGAFGPAWAKNQDEVPIFSGPQPGEPLPAFEFRELLVDSQAGQLDLVTQSGSGPLLLIFVHEVNRPSIALTRILSSYARSRATDGLKTGIVFLDADPADAESKIKRMQHALTANVPTGVSLEGAEGPGSLGLNRQVALTILIAEQQKVTANFALVQPSLQVDLPRILDSLVAIIGGQVPTLAELERDHGLPARPATAPDSPTPPNLRPLLAPVIQKTATPEAVIQAAQTVEKAAEADAATRTELGRIARTIVQAGVLEKYGTAKAQEYLKKWASQYGGLDQDPRPR
jgi:hypothetical protein